MKSLFKALLKTLIEFSTIIVAVIITSIAAWYIDIYFLAALSFVLVLLINYYVFHNKKKIETIDKEVDCVKVPKWVLKEVENTLRLTSNIHESPNRNTCFDRCVMKSWNFVYCYLNGIQFTGDDIISNFNKIGQKPNKEEKS